MQGQASNLWQESLNGSLKLLKQPLFGICLHASCYDPVAFCDFVSLVGSS